MRTTTTSRGGHPWQMSTRRPRTARGSGERRERLTMTFNPNADISRGKVSKRGRNTGIAVGGGLGVIALFVLSQFLGVDLTGLVGGGRQPEPGIVTRAVPDRRRRQREHRVPHGRARRPRSRRTGCRRRPEHRPRLRRPAGLLLLFDPATTTGCGNASSATGPFYCPPDQTIYIDVTFYDELREPVRRERRPARRRCTSSRTSGGTTSRTSPGSSSARRTARPGPTSNAVRVELQADCFAGAWAADAADRARRERRAVPAADHRRRDRATRSSAAAVGDDRIQEATQGQVTPALVHAWHERAAAALVPGGFQQGAGACDTFSVSQL